MTAGEWLNIADYFLGDRVREGHGDQVALRLDDGTRTYAETERLARARGIRLMHLVGPRAAGPTPSWLPAHLARLGDAEALLRIAPDIAAQDVYVCGPDGFVETAAALLLQAGQPRDAIRTERFGPGAGSVRPDPVGLKPDPI